MQLTWTPQRVVDAALLLSGATLAASLVLVVLPRSFLPAAWDRVGGFARRRRRRRTKSEVETPPLATTTGTAVVVERVEAPDDVPSLAPALSSDGERPSWIGLIGWPVVTGLVAGALTGASPRPSWPPWS